MKNMIRLIRGTFSKGKWNKKPTTMRLLFKINGNDINNRLILL